MNDKIISRIKRLLEHYDLSVSAFADHIGVQRSSMSHILNGRNRPSLDFILKVVQAYPEVNLYWLLNGKGTFPSEGNGTTSPTLKFSETTQGAPKEESHKVVVETKSKEISRIVLFYSDGTFESFDAKKQ
nr:helix-turn-helix transcriptional regulator [Allomuricauda sp.]